MCEQRISDATKLMLAAEMIGQACEIANNATERGCIAAKGCKVSGAMIGFHGPQVAAAFRRLSRLLAGNATDADIEKPKVEDYGYFELMRDINRAKLDEMLERGEQ